MQCIPTHNFTKNFHNLLNNKLMPCPFTGRKMFCAGSTFLSQPKNLTAFSASSKTFVPAQKPIFLNANHLFVRHKIFVTGRIRKKNFGPKQKNWAGKKHFATCIRTRHKSVLQFTLWLLKKITNLSYLAVLKNLFLPFILSFYAEEFHR